MLDDSFVDCFGGGDIPEDVLGDLSKMAQVNFRGSSVGKLLFEDLDLNDSFVIDSPASHGAVYRKVRKSRTSDYYMMEEATGKLFDPTVSNVKKVNVAVQIDTNKPSIY